MGYAPGMDSWKLVGALTLMSCRAGLEEGPVRENAKKKGCFYAKLEVFDKRWEIA